MRKVSSFVEPDDPAGQKLEPKEAQESVVRFEAVFKGRPAKFADVIWQIGIDLTDWSSTKTVPCLLLEPVKTTLAMGEGRELPNLKLDHPLRVSVKFFGYRIPIVNSRSQATRSSVGYITAEEMTQKNHC